MSDQPSYRLITAALILIAYFGVAGVVLYNVIGAPVLDGTWNQIVLIFNAIGALATTAAGVLLGAEVQQANVRNAQRDSQAHAAAAALATLESSGDGAALGDGISKARAILQQALASGRPDIA